MDDDGAGGGGDEGGRDLAEAGLRGVRALRRADGAVGRAGGYHSGGELGPVGPELRPVFGGPAVGDYFSGEGVGEDAVCGVFVEGGYVDGLQRRSDQYERPQPHYPQSYGDDNSRRARG